MSTAQQLLGLLANAKPGPNYEAKPTPKPAAKYSEKYSKPALKAVRFTVELPELGGAVELCPARDFSPVHCKHCGIARENVQQSCLYKKTNKVVRWWAPVPCNCGGLR